MATDSGQARRRILLVDDHDALRTRVRGLLVAGLDQVDVLEAASGAEALAWAATGQATLVILDLRLPDLPGLEVLRRLRASYADLPVIIMSNLPEQPYAEIAARGGACGFVSKSALAAELLSVASAALDGAAGPGARRGTA